MKKDYKLFNKINIDLNQYENKTLSEMEIDNMKNRFNNKLKLRKQNTKKIPVAVAALILVLTTCTLTNETALANISKANETIKTTISKAIGKYKDDESTKVFEEKVSHNVIVYNTHNFEKYENGLDVTDVGKVFSDSLNKLDVDSVYINGATVEEYGDSYEYANAVVQNNINDFENSFLVDIHRGIDDSNNPNKSDKFTMEFLLTKSNPNYEESKKLAELICDEIKNLSDINTKISTYTKGISNFNQDLSPKAILVDIGTESSSKENINNAITVFSQALKKVMSHY